MYKQEPPFSLSIGLTEGCSLRCPFCGIKSITEKQNEYRFMTLETADLITTNLSSWLNKIRIRFAMKGEPSMNPEAPAIIKLFRERMPKASMLMLTNGSGFLVRNQWIYGGKEYCRQRIELLLKCGLNMVTIEDYEHARFREMIEELSKTRFDRYPEDAKLNPHRMFKPNDKFVVVMADLRTAGKGSNSTVNNACGMGAPPNDSQAGKRCEKPFREMAITHEGYVVGCCNDWRGYYLCGDLRKTNVKDIWYGPAFDAMREMLYWGRREFGACKGCDHRANRPGLLPDKLGKEEMPKPTMRTMKRIADATAHDPITKRVKLPWE